MYNRPTTPPQTQKNSLYSYWQKQDAKNPLFQSTVDLNRPEQKQLAGKLAIIGGKAQAFFTVANAAQVAESMSINETLTFLPDSLKGQIPITADNLHFLPSESSGGFARSALTPLLETTRHTDALLLIGDFGKSPETANLIAQLLTNTDQRATMARDTIDLIIDYAPDWASRQNLTLCVSLKQLQKLTQSLYYPRMITMTMPTNQIVETLHKITLSLPMTLVVLGDGQVIAAKDGAVISTPLTETNWNPITFWNGQLITKGAILEIWNPTINPAQVWSRAILS